MPRLVSVKNATEHYGEAFAGRDGRYLRKLIADRRIPFVKLGEGRNGKVLVDLDVLDDVIRTSTVPVAQRRPDSERRREAADVARQLATATPRNVVHIGRGRRGA